MNQLLTFAVVAVLALAGAARAEPAIELKIATLAPPGSSWAKLMLEGSAALETATQGRVKFKYFFGGQQGDERDMVRKMKLGQIDGAALTAVGLGLIQPDVLVLQLPFMFTSDKQVDYVREQLGPDFAKEFDAAGYVLVSWGDVGWVHTFTTIDIKTKDELAAAKVWEWVDDPIVREYFGLLGVNGVPLGVPDVLPALETGTIQACYGPPLAAVVLQWYTKLKYMTDVPSAYGIGALVIKKEAFARLSPGDQRILMQGAHEMGLKLTANVRRDNERAKVAMAKAGIITIHVPDDAQALFMQAGKAVWGRLAGKLYSKELLDKLIKTVAAAPR